MLNPHNDSIDLHQRITNSAHSGWLVDLAVRTSEERLKWMDAEQKKRNKSNEELLQAMPYRRIEAWLVSLDYLIDDYLTRSEI